MSEQLIFNFPFKKNYLKQDFYVSKNNFNAYKLIESWPKWPSRLINIFGPSGCGKTHLVNILKSKIQSVIISSDNVSDEIRDKLPIGHKLYVDYIEKILTEPDKQLIEFLFK